MTPDYAEKLRAANNLVQSRDFEVMIEALSREYISGWATTSVADTEGRERFYQMLMLVEDLKNLTEAYASEYRKQMEKNNGA